MPIHIHTHTHHCQRNSRRLQSQHNEMDMSTASTMTISTKTKKQKRNTFRFVLFSQIPLPAALFVRHWIDWLWRLFTTKCRKIAEEQSTTDFNHWHSATNFHFLHAQRLMAATVVSFRDSTEKLNGKWRIESIVLLRVRTPTNSVQLLLYHNGILMALSLCMSVYVWCACVSV